MYDDPIDMELARVEGKAVDSQPFEDFWHVCHQNFSPYLASFRLLDRDDDPQDALFQSDGSPALHLQVCRGTLDV